MKFVISYAYDVPHYSDYLVDAKDEAEALEKAKAAFSAGRFEMASCEPDDSVFNKRVFVLRSAAGRDEEFETL